MPSPPWDGNLAKRSKIGLIQEIEFQLMKSADTKSDEDLVQAAQELLNGLLDSGDTFVDGEMPTDIFGVTIDWTVGTANDNIYTATKGDYSVQADTTQVPINVTLKQPTGLTASYQTLEEAIELEWDEVVSASGYIIYRDGQTSGDIVFDGLNVDFTINGGRASYIDNVGDSIEHTYYIIAKDADPNDNSSYSTGVIGRGEELVLQTANINISGYNEQIITLPAGSKDIVITASEITGASGGQVSLGPANYGGGGQGINYYYDGISDGAHIIKFQSGERPALEPNGGIPIAGRGYFEGSTHTNTDATGFIFAGGGASRIVVDDTPICGAGGGSGNGVADTTTSNKNITSSGAGGGIYSAATPGGINIVAVGGDGGGADGVIGQLRGNDGEAVAAVGSFQSTGVGPRPNVFEGVPCGANGKIIATINWRQPS